ncbi:MAG: type IX secretion system outer membrane channel protein PorV [Microscillaceae bacterium]|nr:type IX secretion system outer membrane channel protein PorV [Microscillaceae bacterium]MDW8459875.1 type IX secretion system outer membrane channel protein PorV [Cytophagales bacterium]
MRNSYVFLGIIYFAVCLFRISFAQTSILLGQDKNTRPVTTSVPFLMIAPDSRASGMGDAGGALSADANAVHWNAAKLAFAPERAEISLSYTPWLRRLGVNDMFLSYLSGYYRLDRLQTLAFSLRYFNLGDMDFTDNNANIIQRFSPREFALNAIYARKLSEAFAVSVGGFMVYSNLAASLTLPNQVEAKPGVTGGAEVSAYYKKDNLMIADKEVQWALGVSFNNIGAKISYSNANQTDFIPVNLRLSNGLTAKIDNFNRITWATDFNKLLVPTPPLRDSTGRIVRGVDPRNLTVLGGIYSGLVEAPDGFSEKLREFTIGTGLEYWYTDASGNDIFAARIGYFHEHPTKGNRKFVTLGTGIRYKEFGLDLSYLLAASQASQNALSDTIRFTFLYKIRNRKGGSIIPVETEQE